MMKLTARTILKSRTQIFLGSDALDRFRKQFHVFGVKSRDVFILVDSNTRNHCLPVLTSQMPDLENCTLLEVPDGEENKSLDTASFLWKELQRNGADRKSLIVNLGGGVISDLGGFVAGGYQRGIRYVNIPTSLIGQVDAAIGGKTGVNLGNIKNQVGLFNPAEMVIIHPEFLSTVPVAHMRSGLAEIIKCSLLMGSDAWRYISARPVDELLKIPADSPVWHKLIAGAVTFKNRIAVKDFREQNLRKILNFGHTLGHAFESYAMGNGSSPVLHGDAVAAGMICASWLSMEKQGLPMETFLKIRDYVLAGFEPLSLQHDDIPAVVELVKFDKKNRLGKSRFTLLDAPGSPKINVACESHELERALQFYLEILNRESREINPDL